MEEDTLKVLAREFLGYLEEKSLRPESRATMQEAYLKWCSLTSRTPSRFSEMIFTMARTLKAFNVVENGTIIRWKQRRPEQSAVSRQSEVLSLQPVEFDGVIVVRNKKSCVDAVTILLKESMLALDCEGVDLGACKDGGLCLVQIGTKSCGVFLFDVVEMQGGFVGLLDAGLSKVLDAPCVKFIHDCRMDIRAIFQASGPRSQHVNNVFDTQIAFSLLNPGVVQAGLNQVLTTYGGEKHPSKASAGHKKDDLYWRNRPLTLEAVQYAAADVSLLLPSAEQMVNHLYRQQKVVDVRDRSRARAIQEIESLTRGEDAPPVASILSAVFGGADTSPANNSKRRPYHVKVATEFNELIAVLPRAVRFLVQALPNVENDLIDIIMDEGRRLVCVLRNRPRVEFNLETTREHLEFLVQHVGRVTGSNRAIVGRSLHRCSFIVDPGWKEWHTTGATIRMARSVQGIADTIQDILQAGKSILLVGRPGLWSCDFKKK